MWKSQESERRLREPIGGRRERSDAVSSSPAPPRPNLAATGAPVTSPGLAKRILGGRGADEELDELVPGVELDPAIDGFGSFQFQKPKGPELTLLQVKVVQPLYWLARVSGI